MAQQHATGADALGCELRDEILALQAGDHLCLFYDKDPAEQMPAIVPFIEQALRQDERFIYIADDQSVDELSTRLEQNGIDVGMESQRGRLRLGTREQWLQPGSLDSAVKSAQIRRFIAEANAEGFKGIRFAVEMTWTLGPEISARDLEHWEATLNGIFEPEFPGRILCQYNRSRLSPAVMLAALRTHPLAILGDQVCPNIFYQAPLILKGESTGNDHSDDHLDAKLEWMTSQLLHARQAERQRQDSVRKHAALAEAEQSRKRIEAILASITDGWLALDPDWKLTFVNPAAEQIIGKSAQELVGESFWKVFPHAKGTQLEIEFTRALVEQVSVSVEYFSPVSNRWFETRASPAAGGLSVYFRDVTRGKRGQDAMRRLAAIVESSDDAIVGKDLDGVITSWNAGAERLFGYTAPEIIGQSITILIPPERQDEEPKILEHIRRGERIAHFETVRRRKDGSLVEVSVTISPIKDERGGIIGASKIARDITAAKRAAEAVRQAHEELARSHEELEMRVEQRTSSLQAAIAQMEEFSYSVSHDLRAPVRAMQGYAKAVLEDYAGKLDDQGKEFLQRILAGSRRMEQLIQDVLTYSRLSRTQIQLQPISLERLVRDIVQQYPDMQPPRAEILVQVPLPNVHAHEPSLMQAISNLLSNAVKFVAPQTLPQVRVRAEQRNGHTRLWVEDNGIGIKPEHQPRLFGLFERVHPGRKYEGTGVGLAIVRKAVERMGGKVGLESNESGGSKFWLELTTAE